MTTGTPETITTITGLAYTAVNEPSMSTWMCDNGYHGTPVRRWERTFEGHCAGTVMTSDAPLTISPCKCECHS